VAEGIGARGGRAGAWVAALGLALVTTMPANAQGKGGASGHAGAGAASPGGAAGGAGKGEELIGNWPRFTLQTLANFEFSGLAAANGPSRGPQPYLRFDTVALVDVNEQLSIDGLFQFKARQPRPADDPNRDLFINQGAGRRVGGKFKELYARYGTWRAGKFVQDFGRAYALLPGPFDADFVEEPDEGYEPSEMIGVEKLHVFNSEKAGWQQLSASAFMVDRTFLHRSVPYDEGQIRYRDGGIGNTKFPENLMVTYDVLNAPVGRGGQLSFQASAIRWGRSYNAEAREFWTTAGANIAIPLGAGSVEDTLANRYRQLRLYVEGAHRNNFKGVANADRWYLTGSGQLLLGKFQFDVTTTQRWTTDPRLPRRKDELYTGTIGYAFPTQTVALLSVASETVGDRHGIYGGIRLVQTITTCSRCFTRGKAY